MVYLLHANHEHIKTDSNEKISIYSDESFYFDSL